MVNESSKMTFPFQVLLLGCGKLYRGIEGLQRKLHRSWSEAIPGSKWPIYYFSKEFLLKRFESNHTQQQCFSIGYRSRDIFPLRSAKKSAMWGYAKQPFTAILIHCNVTAHRIASIQYQIPVARTGHGRNLLAPTIPIIENRMEQMVMAITNVFIFRSPWRLCMASSSSKVFSKASKLMVSIKKSVKPNAGNRICKTFMTILQQLTMMQPRTKSQKTPQQRSAILWSSRFTNSEPVLTRCNAEELLGNWKAAVAAVLEVRLLSVQWSEQLLGGWFSRENVSDVSCSSLLLFLANPMPLRTPIVPVSSVRLRWQKYFLGKARTFLVVKNWVTLMKSRRFVKINQWCGTSSQRCWQ